MPLHVAAGMGRREIADFLLTCGADIEAKDRRGRTALSLARDRGYDAIAALLSAANSAWPQVDTCSRKRTFSAMWRFTVTRFAASDA